MFWNYIICVVSKAQFCEEKTKRRLICYPLFEQKHFLESRITKCSLTFLEAATVGSTGLTQQSEVVMTVISIATLSKHKKGITGAGRWPNSEAGVHTSWERTDWPLDSSSHLGIPILT